MLVGDAFGARKVYRDAVQKFTAFQGRMYVDRRVIAPSWIARRGLSTRLDRGYASTIDAKTGERTRAALSGRDWKGTRGKAT